MSNLSQKNKNLSQNPGVYIFKDSSGRILYIGKATNLRSRVGSYFSNSRKEDRPVMAILEKVVKIETRETDSVLEALILESNLIKKHQPPFNIDLKDDKSFSFVAITKEEFPRVLIVRESDLDGDKKQVKIKNSKLKISKAFGPYTSKKQLEVALKIIRKIFPYHSRKEKNEKGCLDFQIGLCPGPYVDAISRIDYQKNIRGIRMILEGKKKGLIRKLEKEMGEYSKKQEFEKAGEIRNRVFALRHIRDVALISGDENFQIENPGFRVEAYDISNISGKQAVGSMVVFEGGEPSKKEYRKFKIKTVEGANDVAMMAEVLFRRFRNDWKKPDLILLDGGRGHLSRIERVLKMLEISIPLVAVSKGPTRKISNFQFLTRLPDGQVSKQFLKSELPDNIKEILKDKNFVGRVIEEAHRFAIGYHRKVRRGEFIEK